jgi:hypothetical protein
MIVHSPTPEQTLRAAPEFARYQQELALWLSGESDEETSLESAGTALCAVARRLAVAPEALLIALRGGQPTAHVQEGTDRGARASQARAHRHTLAVHLLMKCYFA